VQRWCMLFLIQSSVWGSGYLERSAEILCIGVCVLLRDSSRRRAALCSARGIPYQSGGQGIWAHLLSCDQQSFCGVLPHFLLAMMISKIL
jgi:hypothetical protein